MSHAVTWALVISALGVVLVRRRTVAIALIALQSLLLGVQALSDAAASAALLVAGAVLVAKALIVPGLLLLVVTRTREVRRMATERGPLARLAAALVVALAAVTITPRLGLPDAGVEHAAVGLVALGIATAVVRRSAIFQALGFLMAENGLYLAALTATGGVPAFIELGLAFDLVVVVSVAGVFSARIHEQLGTGDTSLLGGLRD